MSVLAISSRPAGRLRAGAARLRLGRRGVTDVQFTPLIDAKAVGRLLGVPHTWLLAQARAGRCRITSSGTTCGSTPRT